GFSSWLEVASLAKHFFVVVGGFFWDDTIVSASCEPSVSTCRATVIRDKRRLLVATISRELLVQIVLAIPAAHIFALELGALLGFGAINRIIGIAKFSGNLYARCRHYLCDASRALGRDRICVTAAFDIDNSIDKVTAHARNAIGGSTPTLQRSDA